MIVMILVLVLAFAGCANSPDKKLLDETDLNINSILNGTWIGSFQAFGDHGEMRMNNGNFDFFHYGLNRIVQKGTYSLSGDTITITINDEDGIIYLSSSLEPRLYPRDEIKSVLNMTDDQSKNRFTANTTYFPIEDKFVWGQITYTRKK